MVLPPWCCWIEDVDLPFLGSKKDCKAALRQIAPCLPKETGNIFFRERVVGRAERKTHGPGGVEVVLLLKALKLDRRPRWCHLLLADWG